jgi:hypothetical protein
MVSIMGEEIDFDEKSLRELDTLADQAAKNQKDASEAMNALGRNESQGSVMDEFGKKQAEIRRKSENGILERLGKVHSNRSRRSRQLDEEFQAEVTDDPVKWKNNPDEYDFPFIDDPSTI